MRVLFCGLGGVGQRHLRNLRLLLGDDLDVHAYRVRRNRTKLLDNLTVEPDADLEVDYRITVHQDLDDALAVAPNAVFVCNPSSMHIDVALAAAAAGSHLFIEKPLSNSLDRLFELQELITAKGLVCYVGYNFRFHPGLIRMKELIDVGYFGHVLGMSAEIGEYLPAWHKYEDYRQMYAARADLGGGVILSQIHEMDLIYWFFGLPKTVLCRGGRLSSLEIDVEDTALSLMQYDGPKGRFPISLHQDFLQRPAVRTFKVIGDAGVARMDLIQTRLQIFGEDGTLDEDLSFPGFQRNDMFLNQARHFLDCVTKGATPRVALSDCVESLRLALAAKESLVRGVEVALS